MIQKRPKDFVEFHEGEKEFCPESGPLKSKKISAPSAAIAALVTSIATAATVYTLVVAPVFAFIPELISVVANVAKIETRIENLPEEASVVYNLSLEETPKEIVFSGEIHKSKDQLEFSNLKYDTDYVVKFYLKENKSKEFLKEIKFRTGKEVIDNPQDPIVPEQPEIPDEPEIPEQPVVPKPPIKPETPEQPVVPNPPVEPEVPEEPEIPETPVTEITVVGADYNGAQVYVNNDTFAGYIMQETHIFENVPSNEYTIQITQDGEITTYNDVYDESTQTVTVSFSGNAISFGETSMSNVVLIYKDGVSATSTNTITTPKLNEVAIAVTDNEDGTFTYTVNGKGVDPSIGTIALEMNVYSDYYELSNNPEVQTKVVNSMTFNDVFESSPIAQGKTLTALVQASATWSLDETNTAQVKEANKEYSILSAPEVVESTIDGAEAVINNDEVVGYVVEETHVFGNVPSDEYTIQITQNGEVTVYSNVYDEETQTATITFKGNTIGLGETGTSEVVLTYKDGVSATSTNSVQTPKLETVTLDVVDNLDGTFTYTMNGMGIEPSVGSVETRITLHTDINEVSQNPVVQTFNKDAVTFEQEYTSEVYAPGETMTAVAFVEMAWSMDTSYSQTKEANKEYSILSAPEVVESTIDGAEAVINNDEVVGYVVEETHVFGNVPSDEYTIQITQNSEVTVYSNVYDEETQTATITFKGNTIGLGETGTSEVVLTYKDGVSATSTNSVQTPKLETVTLDVVDNEDGTFTYTMNGMGIEPSVGSVETRITLHTDINEVSQNPVVQTFNKDAVTFEQEYTSEVYAPGETMTAVAFVEMAWSLDTSYSQTKEANKEYSILSAPEVVSSTIDGAEAYIDEDEFAGYTIEETHVFGNVPSDEYTIQITQNGEVTVYSNVYDEETQTATITFKGNTIGLGETGTSEVVLTYKDGVSATSTNTITTPKLNEVAIAVTDNEDGTFTYAVNGNGIDPSIGTIALEMNVYSDYYELSNNPEVQTKVVNSMTFNDVFESSPIAQGKTLTALVQASAIWSLDETNTAQVKEANKEYSILSAPEVVESTIDGAEAVINNDEVVGYVVEETHVFGNVPSDEYEININQGQITNYTAVYDEETQTATIKFKGNTIGLGETGTSEVVLTYKDGVSATSTNSVQTPKLETVTLDVVDNLDGTFTYTMNGMGIEPSVGSVETRITLHTDINDVSQNSVAQTYTKDTVAFEEAYTGNLIAPGKTLTAVAFVEMAWSLDTSYSQTKEANKEYSILSAPEVVSSTIDGAEAYIDEDEFAGYTIEETHVFGNIPSDEFEISINNGQITNYDAVYDGTAETVTVHFVGNPIGLGETSTTEVILTYKDGESASSTTTVQTPKMEAVTLEVVDNQDGTFTYRMNGSGVEPSIGEVETRVTLYTDINDVSQNPVVQTYTKDTVAFEEAYTGTVGVPGKKTAVAFVEVVWSMDTTSSNQIVDATVDYEILDVSEISFTDIYEEGAGYAYTVNAKFANLANAVPQSVDFYRQVYNPMYPDEAEEEQLIMTLDASEITIDDNSNILVSYTVSEDQVVYRESSGNTWRIVLTYLDLNNVTRTVELVDYIEPFSPAFNHLNSVMWQENGVTYADYEMVFSFSKDYSPNGAELVRYDAYNWEILSAELELTDSLGFVRGQMMTDRTTELSINLYLDWLATPAEEYIYSGCGGAGYREFTITNQELVANADNTGYASTSEEFTLFNGSDYVSEYSNEYIVVTLADGTQIKVSEDETDASGVVTVNWNDNNNVVVTVNQTDVLLGQTAIVDFVTESVREEEAMFGLVNSYTYRCFSNYE